MTRKITPLPARLIDIHNHLAKDDDDGVRLIGIMDEYNIETTLIMGTPRSANERIVRAVGKQPGRLVGGAYIDPREGKKAVTQVKHWHDEGVHVVKLFPNLGYYPDADEFRPFFDAISEHGMAVLSHCGWLGGKDVTAAYYSHPGRFEKPIRRHPETIFIMAHMGGIAGVLETVMLTTRTPNTFVDCSPGQGLWALQSTGGIAGSVPPDKLMWGVDSYWPQDVIEAYQKALHDLGFGPHFDKIFYLNARGVLEKIGALEKSS